MALSANVKLRERSAPAEFAYLAASGVHVYEGALVALNSSGALVRPQDAGAVVFAGLADGERDNTLGTETRPVRCRRGTWAMPVPSATAANIGATVYAVDDNTLSLGTVTIASAVKSGGNTGTGTIQASPPLTAGAGAKPGPYTLTMTAATTFTITDPNGDSLPGGSTGAAYTNRGISFQLNAGGTPFIAGDGFVITVANSPVVGLAAGVLAGIESSLTYVKLI